MKSTTKIFISLFTIGLLGIFGYYFYSKSEESKFKSSSTDAKNIKDKLVIGVDNWIGYFPLCSPKLASIMRSLGYLVECVQDGADYDDRMRKLKKGEYDFAVATVDSFLINGNNHNYPGSIVLVIDESKGGDAIVAKKALFPNLDSLKNPDAEYKIAFTPQSPSEHLIRSVSSHFDIPRLKKQKDWRYETDGSEEALKKLMKGKVNVATLWEPDVSKALENKKFVKLLGTEDTKGLIVDILVAGNKTIQKKSHAIKKLLQAYFMALKHYQKNNSDFIDDIKKETKLSEKNILKMLKGVSFANLYDNAIKWFGIKADGLNSKDGLIATIQSTSDIFIETGATSNSIIPEGNPYLLQSSSFIENLFKTGITFNSQNESVNDTSEQFTELSDSEWQQLRDVGTLKVRPITFKSGTSEIDFEGQGKIQQAISSLNHYPNFRVVVYGHTGVRGDRAANLNLSIKRAESVRNYMITQLGVSPNRIRSVGVGSLKPLPRKPGESSRAYNYRLPRVELRLVSEVF